MTYNSLPVAIMGQNGSYHDMAAASYFGDAYEPRYLQNFAAVFDAVASGSVERGVTAIENTQAGTIPAVYDLLRTTGNVAIVGEIYLAIHCSLVGTPDARKQDISTIYSHFMALRQCSGYLGRELPGVDTREVSDTASGVLMVRDAADPSIAAIGSARTALKHGLQIIDENIEDDPSNTTRFVILSRPDKDEAGRELCATKTSLLLGNLATNGQAMGKLAMAIGCFAMNDIPITRIESRPISGKPWEYNVYVDLAAGASEERMRSSMQILEAEASCRVLGTYQEGATIS